MPERSRSFGGAGVLVALVAGGLIAGAACGKSGGSSNGRSDAGDVTGGDAATGTPDGTIPPPNPDADAGPPLADASAPDTSTQPPPPPAACNGSVKTAADAGAVLPPVPAVTLATGFVMEAVAHVQYPRQLVALPNGDLLVGTSLSTVYLVPNADGPGIAGEPVAFATTTDPPFQGITYDPSTCTIFAATNGGVYATRYKDAQTTASFGAPIAGVRTGPVAPNSDGDVHKTTSVDFTGSALYVGVGSSCNACTEADPTRSVVLRMNADGGAITTKATRFRNAIALATNPATGTLWAGGAGQDSLPEHHPFEFFDAVTLHAGVADYGWPECEENHVAYTADASCAGTVAPRIELPAYSTIIGAAFYPTAPTGAHAFPAPYRGGVFLTAHGSWHSVDGGYVSPPRVVFVPMNGDTPVTPVDWSNADAQWTEFVGGYQLADGVSRIGRPTGLVVGPDGSLFVGDDYNQEVFRIRPQ